MIATVSFFNKPIVGFIILGLLCLSLSHPAFAKKGKEDKDDRDDDYYFPSTPCDCNTAETPTPQASLNPTASPQTTASPLPTMLPVDPQGKLVFQGEYELECRTRGMHDSHVDAEFEIKDERMKFDVDFEARTNHLYQQGQVLPVYVDGVAVGEIMLLLRLDGDLKGELEFDTNSDGHFDDDQPFPQNFPRVKEGSNVVVGPLGCTLH